METSSDKLVSAEAIDLIIQILREKEYRLCSRKYMLNDYMHSKRPYGLINRPADRTSKDYNGFYVYPDDAGEIKAHPFFEGINWDELHIRTPPFIPKVKNWEDTKYFEEDEPISDVGDSSSIVGSPNPITTPDQEMGVPNMIAPDLKAAAEVLRNGRNGSESKLNDKPKQLPSKMAASIKASVKVYKKRKEKKRPRDKILRDAVVGKAVMDIRKRGAFIGYTYRRPKGINFILESERWTNLPGPERGIRYHSGGQGAASNPSAIIF